MKRNISWIYGENFMKIALLFWSYTILSLCGVSTTEHIDILCDVNPKNGLSNFVRGLSKKFVEFVNKNKTSIPIAFKFVYN